MPPPRDNFQGRHGHPPGAAAPKRPEVIHTNNSPEERKAKIDAGVQQLRNYTSHGGKLFHSTSSKAWEGLGKTGGLVPPTMLRNYGIKRVTGEGDVNVPGEKSSVYFGQGSLGLGRALGYFELNQKSTNFSPHLYGGKELHDELSKTRHIVKNWNLPRGESFRISNLTVDLKQAQSRLRQLETEKELRDALPHRARNTQPYPMMFDLVMGDRGEKKVNLDHRFNDGSGEVMVDRPVMFKDHLKRVFVPVNNMEHAKKQLNQMLGRGHSVEVIPMESLMQTLRYQRDEGRDREKASKAATSLQNKELTFKGITQAESAISGLYNEAAATLPLKGYY